MAFVVGLAPRMSAAQHRPTFRHGLDISNSHSHQCVD